jgi:DNA polymerase III gamma/tau subunit
VIDGAFDETDSLHTRFRPTRFKDVIGNEDEVVALYDAVKAKRQQTYLLVGPSGVGKTTLARIASKALGCVSPFGMTEINASKYTGVDDMRAVEDMTVYHAFGSPARSIVVDECQSLSPNAWQSLLKATEEPPKHVYWFFCTTNPMKVPATVKTRALTINLGTVSEAKIQKLVENVAIKAKIELPEGVAELIAYESGGSPRQALVYLEKVSTAPDYQSAQRNLQKADAAVEAIELCRYLCAGGKLRWEKASFLLEQMQKNEENPEGIRIVAVNYVQKALRGAKDDDRAAYLLNVLNNFSIPFNQAEQYAPLWLAVGRIIFNR